MPTLLKAKMRRVNKSNFTPYVTRTVGKLGSATNF